MGLQSAEQWRLYGCTKHLVGLTDPYDEHKADLRGDSAPFRTLNSRPLTKENSHEKLWLHGSEGRCDPRKA